MVVEQTKRTSKIAALTPAAADVLAIIALVLWLVPFSNQLDQPSGWNAFLLVLFYILFCVGVFLIRKLQMDHEPAGWQTPKILLDRRVRAALAFLFGLLMVTTMAYQLGYFASIQNVRSAGLDEGSSSSLLVYMPGALLGFSMLYILVLAFPVQESVKPGSDRALIYAVLSSLLINGMLLFSTAQAKVLIGDFNLSGKFLVFAAALIILIISFLPPRVLLNNKYPSKVSFVSFATLLLIASLMAAG